MDEGGVVFRSNALEHHPEKFLVGLQDALLHGIALHMLYSIDALEYGHHRVAYLCRKLFVALQGHEVGNRYMASKTYHLVPDGMLESQDNTDADNHYGKSYCHTDGSNAYGRS